MLPHATRPDPGPKKHYNRADSRPDPRRIRAKNCADSLWIQAGSRSNPAIIKPLATRPDPVAKQHSNRAGSRPDPGRIRAINRANYLLAQAGSRSDVAMTLLHATGRIQVPKSTPIEPGPGWIQAGSEPKTVRIRSGFRPDPNRSQLL